MTCWKNTVTVGSATPRTWRFRFARYFTVGPEIAGKTISTKLPEGAAYAVYDENDACVNFTTVSKENETMLPPNGKIAFVGKAGDVFTFEFQ